jgi:hypothetical protein
MRCDEGEKLFGAKEIAENDLAMIKAKTPLPVEPLGSATPKISIDKIYLEKWRGSEDAKKAYASHLEFCKACSLG